MASVGTISAEVRATTTGLRRDMADAVAITKSGTQAMSQQLDQVGKSSFAGVTEQTKKLGSTFDDLLKGPLKRHDDAQKTTTHSLSEVTRTSRALSGHLLSELSPALGSVVQATNQAAGATGGMSGAWGLAAAAAAGFLAVVAAYVRATKEATEAQAKFNLALRAGDIQGLRGRLQQSLLALEEYAVNVEKPIGRIINLFDDLMIAIGWKTDPRKEAAKAKAGIAQLFPLERTGIESRAHLQSIQAEIALMQSAQQQAQRLFDLTGPE